MPVRDKDGKPKLGQIFTALVTLVVGAYIAQGWGGALFAFGLFVSFGLIAPKSD